MINGIQILQQMYPDMDEENYQPSGLDLNLGKVYKIDDSKPCGLVNGQKILPKHIEIEPQDFVEYGFENCWKIEYGNAYIFEVDKPIQIGAKNAQIYFPRSSVLRCGTNICTALGDSGYYGKLSFLVANQLKAPFFISKGERMAQLIDCNVEGVTELYNGDYQEPRKEEKLDKYLR